MKTMLVSVLLITLAACSLTPAPITTLDVKATMSGQSGREAEVKLASLYNQTYEREDELRSKWRTLEIVLYSTLICPLLLSIPTLVIQTPARNEIKGELRMMETKRADLDSIIDGILEPASTQSAAAEDPE